MPNISFSLKPNVSTYSSIKDIRDVWFFTTSFGKPVEPEVKIPYRGSQPVTSILF